MHDYQLRITKHAYKRYKQQVGGMPMRVLMARSQTALSCRLYHYGSGVIKLCGIRWGCRVQRGKIVLTTCLGRQDRDRYAVQA